VKLHDSIAQSLAFLKIQVQLLRNAASAGSRTKVNGILDELDAGLRESINDVRELLVHFRTRTNTDDIEQALQETLQKFEHQTGLPPGWRCMGQGLPLPADVQVQVSACGAGGAVECAQTRRCQPCVPGQCERAALALRGARQWLPALTSARFAASSHVGLKIMRERAARIGGEVEITSAHGARAPP
jgi:two-component system nitrate/nitrite sensor histidine kinase NarX